MEIFMRTFPDIPKRSYFGVNMEAPRKDAAKKRQEAYESDILRELKENGYTLDSGELCRDFLKEWALRKGLAVDPYEKRKGMYFLISKEKNFVSLVAVGMKMP